MIVQAEHGPKVVRASLPGFERGDDVRRQFVHDVSGVNEVSVDIPGGKVRSPIVLLAGVDVERKARRGEHGNLPPFAVAVNGNRRVRRQDVESSESPQSGNVLAVERLSRKFDKRNRPNEPVD